ncbi:hypothetical protein Pcinc_001537 [Petrolisthes cinctipes]|uniref:Uncharacterized protein n=1 Tax=Petrolisthes cinctipes TaxID=88211 RepID=A0AAE1L364_PETCI|nr:hypothetical protein Pcinc_001537 [Petrolisthes cinctipes]
MVRDQFVRHGITFAVALPCPVTVRQDSLLSNSTLFNSRGVNFREEYPGNSGVLQPKRGCTSSEEAPAAASRSVSSVELLSTPESAFQVAFPPPVQRRLPLHGVNL